MRLRSRPQTCYCSDYMSIKAPFNGEKRKRGERERMDRKAREGAARA